ncbi:YcfL family protein [Enterovibrio coralii]|uniref:YcfL protein: an outer membrane lipoprotein that is part of a salvage cluster n=1 Tax=Enterovibrio coralii TaxID=294935 RepID=A0A135I925_9GAMM|nr:YcfL family protein [Enterovibrio coralii]KXF81950.1 hypothetical protein ATN88_18490 [Enterovibrio coralii]
MRYAVALLSAVLLVAGCATNSSTGISIDSSNQNVVLGNSTLGEALEFGNAQTSIVNERLLAQVKVTNTSSEVQNLQYRFNWYDAQGLEVDNGNSPWKPFIVYAGDSVTLQGVALSSNATNFRVSLRNVQ